MELVGPYIGEFGWDVRAWAPFVSAKMVDIADRLVVADEPGRELLYRPLLLAGARYLACRTSMLPGVAEWLSRSETLGLDVAARVSEQLETSGVTIERVHVPGYGPESAFSVCAQRGETDYGNEWNPRGERPAIACFARDRAVGGRDWPAQCWTALVDYLLAAGFAVSFYGTPGGNRAFAGGRDRRFAITNLAALVAEISTAHVVIGESSGPLHLAATAGVPFVVWGEPRVADRYEADNWHGRPFRFGHSLRPTPEMVGTMVASVLADVPASV